MKSLQSVIFCLLFIQVSAQKASLNVRLIDSSFASPSDYIFEVEIKNDSFDKYWVQDTAILKERYLGLRGSLFYSFLEKYDRGHYRAYPHVKRNGDAFLDRVDSLELFCHSCIYLGKGESVKIRISLLKNATIEKGQYMLEVSSHPPADSCYSCEQLKGIYTDYYFTVP